MPQTQVPSSGIQDAAITQAKLGANVGGNGPAFSAYQSVAQTLPSGSYAKIQLQTEEFDTNNNFDNATNYRFTPTVAGWYQITGAFGVSSYSNGTAAIYKNGSSYKIGTNSSASLYTVTGLVYLNGSTDYVELFGYVTTGQNTTATAYANYLQGVLVRAA